MNKRAWSSGILLALLALDGFVWTSIFRALPSSAYLFAMLDVGQGDASVIRAPSGATFMTDAGPDASAVRAMENILPSADRIVDVAIITHPQRDHYGGFVDALRRFRVRTVVWNGREPDADDEIWHALKEEIARQNIPFVALGAGDRIRHGEMTVDVLSPDPAWRESGEPNDTGIVERVVTPAFTALLTADIGTNVERDLRERLDIRADILKVGHHGSKYSSSPAFLSAVRPALAVIGVGRGNRYGHPAPATLERLVSSAGEEHVFRTDRDGTIQIIGEAGKPLSVFVERERGRP